MSTKNEWYDEVWNPVTECNPIGEVTYHQDRLLELFKWKKPRRVLVCSMGDLFHESVKDWQLHEIFGTMLACKFLCNHPDHVFMLLTKRPWRLTDYLSRDPVELLKAWSQHADGFVQMDDDERFSTHIRNWCSYPPLNPDGTLDANRYGSWEYPQNLFPLSNIWFGVSAENQQRVDERIPILAQIPAAKRFVAVEPIFGSVNLVRYLNDLRLPGPSWGGDGPEQGPNRLSWVIIGQETGPGARPAEATWFNDIIRQCKEAEAPVFVKKAPATVPIIREFPG